MKALPFAARGEELSILCLGAHSDDIEIGAGGTLLSLIASGVRLNVHWCVLSAAGPRAGEAEASARAFLRGAGRCAIELADFDDSFFPGQAREIKAWLAALRERIQPDVILTHNRHDAHQDHRTVSELTTNVFRDHLVLEYEIPKWDGDLAQPNAYVPLSAAILDRKVELLLHHFSTQRAKDWFDAETFRGLARLRGMETRAPERYAEAFVIRKLCLDPGPAPDPLHRR